MRTSVEDEPLKSWILLLRRPRIAVTVLIAKVNPTAQKFVVVDNLSMLADEWYTGDSGLGIYFSKRINSILRRDRSNNYSFSFNFRLCLRATHFTRSVDFRIVCTYIRRFPYTYLFRLPNDNIKFL